MKQTKKTKQQLETISILSAVLGEDVNAIAINKRVLIVSLSKKITAVKVERICSKYNLGKVEKNGTSQIAITKN